MISNLASSAVHCCSANEDFDGVSPASIHGTPRGISATFWMKSMAVASLTLWLLGCSKPPPGVAESPSPLSVTLVESSETAEKTNSVPKPDSLNVRVRYAEVAAARAALDRELQADAGKLGPLEIKATKKAIVAQAKRLGEIATDFQEKFPGENGPEILQHMVFSGVLDGMLDPGDAASLFTYSETVTDCRFAALFGQQLRLSLKSTSQLQPVAVATFADAVAAGLKFEPESYSALNRFLMRANPSAVRELARAITNSPTIDQSLNESASLALNRKYALDVPLELEFEALDGRKLDLATMQGKVVLVAFWATGCVPCMEKLPELKSLYQKYHDRGFEVVGISTDANGRASFDLPHAGRWLFASVNMVPCLSPERADWESTWASLTLEIPAAP